MSLGSFSALGGHSTRPPLKERGGARRLWLPLVHPGAQPHAAAGGNARGDAGRIPRPQAAKLHLSPRAATASSTNWLTTIGFFFFFFF